LRDRLSRLKNFGLWLTEKERLLSHILLSLWVTTLPPLDRSILLQPLAFRGEVSSDFHSISLSGKKHIEKQQSVKKTKGKEK
jgi:hypothetical protein